MLNTILQWNYEGVPKPIVKWERMLAFIYSRENHYTRLIENSAISTNLWTHLIKRLLSIITVEAIYNLNSSAAKISSIMTDCVPKLEDILAPNYRIIPRFNHFTDSHNRQEIQEFIVPCRSETPLLDLPLTSAIDTWKHVKSIHIIYNDSNELCGDFLTGKFKYKYPPKEVIVAIDCISLTFQYYKYFEYCKQNNKAFSKTDFIKEFIIGNLYTDITRCWNLKILESCITDTINVEEPITYNNIVNNGLVDDAVNEAVGFVNRLSAMNYASGDFISTPWLLGTENTEMSIYNYLLFLKHKITLPMLHNNAHIRFMVVFPIVRMIMKLNNLANRAYNKQMNRGLGIDLKRMKQANIFAQCSPWLKEKLLGQLDELIQLSHRDDNIRPEAATRSIDF